MPLGKPQRASVREKVARSRGTWQWGGDIICPRCAGGRQSLGANRATCSASAKELALERAMKCRRTTTPEKHCRAPTRKSSRRRSAGGRRRRRRGHGMSQIPNPLPPSQPTPNRLSLPGSQDVIIQRPPLWHSKHTPRLRSSRGPTRPSLATPQPWCYLRRSRRCHRRECWI